MTLTAQMTPAMSGPKKVFSIGDESVTLAQLNAAGYIAPYGDLEIFTTVALTAARTVALPPAASMIPGASVTILDLAGGCTSSNKITATLNGSDNYQGASTSPTVAAANAKLMIASNGTQWNTAD